MEDEGQKTRKLDCVGRPKPSFSSTISGELVRKKESNGLSITGQWQSLYGIYGGSGATEYRRNHSYLGRI